jgi:signal peptidase I
MSGPAATPELRDGRAPAWPSRLSFIVSAFYVYTLAWLVAWVIFGVVILRWDPVLITSGSMQPHIRAGDMVLVDDVGEEQLSPGSVITFSFPGAGDDLVTHRIMEVTADGAYLTKGDANPSGDSSPVEPGDVFGAPRLLVSTVGLPLLWLRTGQWPLAAIWLVATLAAVSHTRSYRENDEEEPPDGHHEPSATHLPAAVAVVLVSIVVFSVLPSTAAFSATTANTSDTFTASEWELFVAVVGGEVHSCGVNDEGKVWCWGRNDKGQLGDGTTTNRTVPIEVTGMTGAAQVTAGLKHSCVVKDDATLWCWGLNADGQLGDTTTTDRTSPIQVVGGGDSGFLTSVTDAAGGEAHTCAVKTDGTVWCWGRNDKGQLGNGTTTSTTSPVQVSGITTAVAVTAGAKHSCAVLSTGGVWCWGLNADGQLGDTTTTDRTSPIQVVGVGGSGFLANATDAAGGSAHTCALRTDNTLRCWGRNDKGQLGNNTTTSTTSPVQVVGVGGSGFLTTATDITAGVKHTCTTHTDNTVSCWGLNASGQLGNNTTTDTPTPVQVVGEGGTGTLTGILTTGAGSNHTCAAHTTHTIHCWGDNPEGQLGNNTTTDSPTPVKAIGT